MDVWVEREIAGCQFPDQRLSEMPAKSVPMYPVGVNPLAARPAPRRTQSSANGVMLARAQSTTARTAGLALGMKLTSRLRQDRGGRQWRQRDEHQARRQNNFVLTSG